MSAHQTPLGADGGSLRRLRSLLLAEGGLMASLVGPAPDGDGNADRDENRDGGWDASSDENRDRGWDTAGGGPAQLAAAGPRAQGRREQYELLVEAIYEGYLLHYRTPRVVRAPGDDLGVLAGDRLYALGLDRLVKLGDVHAVAELADVITLTALAHGDGRAELADALWRAGAHAVGWGPSAAHERAKSLTRGGSPEALAALQRLSGA